MVEALSREPCCGRDDVVLAECCTARAASPAPTPVCRLICRRRHATNLRDHEVYGI